MNSTDDANDMDGMGGMVNAGATDGVECYVRAYHLSAYARLMQRRVRTVSRRNARHVPRNMAELRRPAAKLEQA